MNIACPIHGNSFTVDRQTEPLVMDSEIAGLPDKHAFLKLGNHVARFSFTYCNMPQVTTDFEPRAIEDDELGFDPLTLSPKTQTATSEQTALPFDTTLAADPDDGSAASSASVAEQEQAELAPESDDEFTEDELIELHLEEPVEEATPFLAEAGL